MTTVCNKCLKRFTNLVKWVKHRERFDCEDET